MEKTAHIVGAGLSHYAGLPLQSDFTKEILAARDFRPGPSREMVKLLDDFVHDVFHLREAADPSQWPDLEDIFTFIDLSANTGHHLGPKYDPKALRRIRRVLIARTIRMLHQRFEKARKKQGPQWKKLLRFIHKLDVTQSRFISVNWDTSLELVLTQLHPNIPLSYGPRIRAAIFGDDGKIQIVKQSHAERIEISKMHGSVNWLYCDSCRDVFWFPPRETLRVAAQIVRKEEIGSGPRHSSMGLQCRNCNMVELSTRMATFSFRKALDFPMFRQSWMTAEQKLRSCGRWVFIGYSLPAADYEFKHLLKRVELARPKRPRIIVVSGGDDDSTGRTLRNYSGLFGSFIRDGETFFRDGLTEDTIRLITNPG